MRNPQVDLPLSLVTRSHSLHCLLLVRGLFTHSMQLLQEDLNKLRAELNDWEATYQMEAAVRGISFVAGYRGGLCVDNLIPMSSSREREGWECLGYPSSYPLPSPSHPSVASLSFSR